MSRYQDIDGQLLHYVDTGHVGEQPPLLLLHGNPTWSYYYRHLISALGKKRRCIAPDHIGMGLSSRPLAQQYPFTLAQRVADLEKLIRSLELPRPLDMVVHDWGGMIGFVLACRYPQWFSRLVVLNSAAFPLPETRHLPWPLRLCRLPGLGALLIRGVNGFSRIALRQCVLQHTFTASEKAAYLEPYNGWRRSLSVHRFVQDIPSDARHPSWELVEQTANSLHTLQSLPMLICWGKRDFVFNQFFLQTWQRYFPHAQVHVFPTAGHYLLEDEPAAVVRLVTDFLQCR